MTAGPEETARLKALIEREILDTPPEPEFDEITALVASVCNTPMAMVTLIDEKRQWFKSQFGLEISHSSREIALCNLTIQQRGVMVMEDAFSDSRFTDNPLVHSSLGICFYAGVPLTTWDDNAIGTLAVLDIRPRKLLQSQLDALRVLARSVMNQIELRKLLLASQRSSELGLSDVKTVAARSPIRSDDFGGENNFHLQLLAGLPGLVFWTDLEARILGCNQHAVELLGRSAATLMQLKMIDLVVENERSRFNDQHRQALQSGHSRFVVKFVEFAARSRKYLLEAQKLTVGATPYLGWIALRPEESRE